MTSALWMGCGMTGKCHHQGRKHGRKQHGALPCDCHQPDTRIGRHAKHGAPRKPGQRDDHRMHHRMSSIQTQLHDARHALQLGPSGKPKHHWLWTGKRYLHLEPAGQREVAPGHVVPFKGKTLGRTGLHVTPAPPHGHLLHAPPPPRGKHAQLIPAHHVTRAGHYGWSPVLHRYAWIDTHKNLSLDPSQLPPKLRHAVTSAIKSSLGHTHAHVAWGVTGHRVYVIPGHWHWNKHNKTWTYVERHTDQTGKVQTHVYPQSKAPSAAFGARPAHAPPLHFWPDPTGTMRDGRNRVPADATTRVTVPPHAHYAKQNGLLDPEATASHAQIQRLRQLTAIGFRRAGRAGRAERLAAESTLIN